MGKVVDQEWGITRGEQVDISVHSVLRRGMAELEPDGADDLFIGFSDTVTGRTFPFVNLPSMGRSHRY